MNNPNTASRTALIVGAAGFVGGYLADCLLQTGEWAVCATKMAHESCDIAGDVYDLDILDKDAVCALLQQVKPDVVFHLAAQSSVGLSWKNPTLTVDVNIKGMLHVLDAVRATVPTARVMLIGSSEEYGAVRPEDIPVRETTPCHPGNLYAVTKHTQNEIGALYAKAYGMDIISTRSFNHIGPNQLPAFVVADFCKQVAQIEAGMQVPVMRVGNLSAMRDFTDVRDIVRAYVLLATQGKAGETYNIGSGKAVAVQDILDQIVAQASVPITVETDPEKLRPVDVPEVRADITKLQAITSWAPTIPLETTLQQTLDYWRAQLK